MSRLSVPSLESATGATRRKDVLSFGPFSLFAAERLLKKADEPIPLGGRALEILIALTQRAGEVVSHKELISSVWPDVTVEEANLRVHIAALRKALGDGRDGARYISNVAGRGYCFVAPVTRSTAGRPATEASSGRSVTRSAGTDDADEAWLLMVQSFMRLRGSRGR